VKKIKYHRSILAYNHHSSYTGFLNRLFPPDMGKCAAKLRLSRGNFGSIRFAPAHSQGRYQTHQPFHWLTIS
jgi:hypothetical protein